MFNFLRRKGPNGGNVPPAPEGVPSPAGADRPAELPRELRDLVDEGSVALNRALAELPSNSFGPFVDELETLLARVAADVEGELPSALHYAAAALEDAGAALIRPIVAANAVELGRLNQTGLYWVRYDPEEMSPEDARTLFSVEAALNRLLVMANPSMIDAYPAQRLVDEGVCLDADWNVLRHVADAAPQRFQAKPNNSLLEIDGARGKRGGEWDVMTRLAEAFELEVLPLRLTYSYASRASEGKVSVRFVAPPEASLPTRVWDANTRSVVEHNAALPARDAYALRLCVLLAAIAFGASEGVTSVTVTVLDGDLAGDVLASLRFSRLQFRSQTLANVRDASLSNPSLDLSPQRVLELLCAQEASVSFAQDGSLAVTEELGCGFVPLPLLGHDTRELPSKLADLVCADRACDLDIFMGVESSLDKEYEELDIDSDTDAAISALEGMISVLDVTCEGDVPLLYCSHAATRYVIGLVDGSARRYRKAPDLAFNARQCLELLYRRREEWGKMAEVCEQMLALAPLALSAREDLSVAYVNLGRPQDAARVLAEGLALMCSPHEMARLYYRLAYALWKLDMKAEALAAYRLCMRHPSMPDFVADEVTALMEEMGASSLPDAQEAGETLKRVGVPFAPTSRAVEAMAKRAVLLTDAGFGNAAAPLVSLLGELRGNAVLVAMANTLMS